MNDVVYQPRCVHCGAAHYALAVPAISHGEAPCGRCGQHAPVFTDHRAYAAMLRRNRQERMAVVDVYAAAQRQGQP
jgi:hypothetical protein